ncbi:MAG: hypothetical protein OHK0029_05330 [Armatimonadaceae bacterium]
MTTTPAAPTVAPKNDPRGFARWIVYQKERFPLLAHGPLVFAFSYSAANYSRLLRGEADGLPWQNIVAAFGTTLLFFLLLRIADEFKDFEDDSRYRPYRPVPRGLVSLRELAVLGGIAAVAQVGFALWLAPGLLPYLLVVWVYMALMTREFFVPEWLKAHPVLYMLSHMAIMPLIDLYATACDWRAAGVSAPHGLVWFLLLSFGNGMVIEIGRKLRAPEQEETGVETYTALWGTRVAPAVWVGAVLLTFGLALAAAQAISFLLPVAAILGTLALLAVFAAVRFASAPTPAHAKWFEPIAGVWTLCLYLSLGALPQWIH